MKRTDRLERLLEEIQSGSGEAVISAAKSLTTLGEFGSPAGTYLLAGGKAALRLGRLADAVVLLYHGLQVAEPNSKVWAELLVNRAIACGQHGFCRDAVTSGEKFLAIECPLAQETTAFVPYAHHAVGFGYDDLKNHDKAVTHYRLAAEMHVDPIQRLRASVDLAFALALSGRPDEADFVLAGLDPMDDPDVTFGIAGATAIVRYHQQRFAEAVAAAERAQALAVGNEERWAVPLAETEYWLARAVRELGDRHRSAALALRVAIIAGQNWRLELRDRAMAWLAEIMDKGGI